MTTEGRVENLLRAAARAEREGNLRLAAILRKMAEELDSPDLVPRLPTPPGAPS